MPCYFRPITGPKAQNALPEYGVLLLGPGVRAVLRGEVIGRRRRGKEAPRRGRGGLTIRGRGPALLRRLSFASPSGVARGAVDAALHFPFFSLGKKCSCSRFYAAARPGLPAPLNVGSLPSARTHVVMCGGARLWVSALAKARPEAKFGQPPVRRLFYVRLV